MHKFISSKEVIARVLTRNISGEGWINLSPLWISNAIAELNIPSIYESVSEELTLVEGSVEIPTNSKYIEHIIYKGYHLRPTYSGYSPNVGKIKNSKYHPVYKYAYQNDYIETTIEGINETITVWYKKLKTEFDLSRNIHYPYILNVDSLKVALMWYILIEILSHGYKVGNLDLTSGIEVLNPMLMWNKYQGMARHDISMSKALMQEFHIMNETLILDNITNK